MYSTKSGRKQRCLSEILNDLIQFLDDHPIEFEHTSYLENPSSLIGKRIRHKFVVGDTNIVEWYHGTIVNYDAVEKEHKIQYDNEEELCSLILIWY